MAIQLSIGNPIDRHPKLSGTLAAIAVVLLPFVAGCSDDDCGGTGPVVDNKAPFPPVGLYSVTRDDLVELTWVANQEADISSYGIYRVRCDACIDCDPSLEYDYVEDVPANQTFGSNGQLYAYYDDTNVVNGQTWWYAVTAVDKTGNESGLSFECVFDTPRPEGTGLLLVELGQDPSQSGYDLGSLTNVAQAWNDQTTDIYFESVGGIDYLRTATGVDIQDWGTIDLLAVDWACGDPTDCNKGWSEAGDAEAVVGHSYVLRVSNGVGGYNFAKVEVVAKTLTTVTLDWAYQTVTNSPELSPGGGRTR